MKRRFSFPAVVILMALSFLAGAFLEPNTARTADQSTLLGGTYWQIHQAGQYEILTDPEFVVDGTPTMAPGNRGWRFTVVARP